MRYPERRVLLNRFSKNVVCIISFLIVISIIFLGCNHTFKINTDIVSKKIFLYNGDYCVKTGSKNERIVVIHNNGLCEIDNVLQNKKLDSVLALTQYTFNSKPNLRLSDTSSADCFILFVSGKNIKYKKLKSRVTKMEWINKDEILVKLYREKSIKIRVPF